MIYINVLVALIFILPATLSLSYFFRVFRSINVTGSFFTVILAVVVLLFRIHSSGLFLIDYLNRPLILASASVFFLSSVFGIGYHHRLGESRNMRLHYAMMDLFASAIIFSLEINNLGLLWIGIELTTASSSLLLVIERGKLQIEAAWRYTIIVSAGLSIALVSVIILFFAYGTLTISTMIADARVSEFGEIAAVAAVVGFGTKVGIFPFGTWLPDAHSQAPSEISAMFSGILLPVALYALYRIYQITGGSSVMSLYLIFGLLTVLVAAILIPSQRDYKRMFAYSSMENMGIAFIGLITGGIAVYGAILLLFSHAFGKAGAFYSSGNVLEACGTKEINRVGDLRDSMPTTAVTLTLSGLCVTGTPPFGTFVGEFLIIIGMVSAGLYLEVVFLTIAIVISFASVNYFTTAMAFGIEKTRIVKDVSASQKSVALVSVAVALLSSLIYFLGVM
ncbi:MAG: hydrogenase 4 subunit F [Candidatus Thermoplasmatota archaeon]|nr:hydrogenase 4 subunit F [Candidatus Thermoplasmatota archaeon]